MNNAPQGPGWWQASDGNWYPPEQHPNYAAPPPPQSSSAPGGYPQYSAPGGQNLGSGSAAFTSVAAKLPFPAWLLYGGLAVALISIFLPWASVSAEGLGETFSLGGVDMFGAFVLIAGTAVLVWVTFTRPQAQRWAPIVLTVLIGLLVIDMITDWFDLDSAAAQVGDLGGLNVSPAVGILLYTAAVGFLAARIVFFWINRSKAQAKPV